MISDRLFVYGTLMRGFDHPMAQLLSANADFLGEARCRGRLYLVRHYPGLVLSDDSADVVHGELFRLRARDELLREFDMYEACGEGFRPPTEYVRQMLSVRLADGAVSDAWTYISTGLSQNCRGLRRAGSWRIEPYFRASPVNSPDNANILRIFARRLDISGVAVQRFRVPRNRDTSRLASTRF